ncbi:SEC-C metal-binding domain-containing protein [Enterobacter asburiae]
MCIRERLSHQTDDSEAAAAIAAQNRDRQVGRKDPCPCGSGKNYKAFLLYKNTSPRDVG